jgi:putative transposase
MNAPGALFHLVARGNARELVFIDDLDRQTFMTLFAKVAERFGWLVYAYCLMGNHYHLVVETPLGNLSRGMGQLNGQYARHFNRRYLRCGHVFQARFRSILIEADTHLLVVSRYVVLNPVRAWICRQPDDWRWSSYRQTAGIDPVKAPLAADQLLHRFHAQRKHAQALYRCFIADGTDERLDEQITGERLGDQSFLRQRIPAADEVPRVQIEPIPPPLEELFSNTDSAPILTAYRRHGYTLKQIADHLGCHYSTVSRKLHQAEQTANPPTQGLTHLLSQPAELHRQTDSRNSTQRGKTGDT